MKKEIVISMIKVVLEKERPRRKEYAIRRSTFNIDEERSMSPKVDEDDTGALINERTLVRGEDTFVVEKRGFSR